MQRTPDRNGGQGRPPATQEELNVQRQAVEEEEARLRRAREELNQQRDELRRQQDEATAAAARAQRDQERADAALAAAAAAGAAAGGAAAPPAAAGGAAAPPAAGGGAAPAAQPVLAVNLDELESALSRVARGMRSSGGTKIPVLDKADPAAFLAWRDRAQAALDDNPEWDDLRRRRRITMALTGEAGKAVRHLHYESYRSVDELLDAYQDVFVTTAASRLTRISFQQALQEEQESLSEWHNRCRLTFQQAYPDVLSRDLEVNVTLIDRFVQGLADPTICQGVFDRNPATYAEALTMAESKLAGLAMIQYRTGTVQPRPLKVKQEPGLFAMNRGPSAVVQVCWGCNRPGHLRRECPHPTDGPPSGRGRGTSAGRRPAGRGGTTTGRGKGNRRRGLASRVGANRQVNAVGNPVDTQEDPEEETPDAPTEEEDQDDALWAEN